MKMKKILFNGIINENPTFRLVLGMCPTLAVSTSAINGIGMGLCATFVLMGSNFVVSLLRNWIPAKVRIPAYVTIIATFVTVVQMLLKAFAPALNQSLGIFIPLIVVNCIILARAEMFASKNPPLPSLIDGLGMGIGFTLALTLIGCIREVAGNGSIFTLAIPGISQPALLMIMAPGGFITLGCVLACIQWIEQRRSAKHAEVTK